MTQFSVPWKPSTKRTYGVPAKAGILAVALIVIAVIGYAVTRTTFDGHPVAMLLLVVGPVLSAIGALKVAVVVARWQSVSAALLRFAGMILIGAVVGTCIGVWAVHGLFAWVNTDLVVLAGDPEGMSLFGASLTLGEIQGAVSWAPGWICALIWPLQFAIVRDLTALGALMGWFNVVPAFVIWWERKVAGRIQSRLGPMRVGLWHGWAQSPADGIKLLMKEDLVPDGADGPLFRLAPYFTLMPVAMAFVAMPFGVGYIFRDLDVALVFILAMLGIEVLGVIMAGWASNNKWSVYGAMREACQMVSYEIPMGMALLVPVICAGSLSLKGIGEAQNGGWFTWLAFANPFSFGAFVAYFIASLASCKRAPFDLPESESELVAGFLTEYSGLRWSMFFFAEYAGMFVVCGLAVILFLGGWHSPLPASWGDALGDGILAQGLKGVLFSGPIWFVLKAAAFLYIQIWLRWTLPRVRIDQVLYACIQVLLPITMALLFGCTTWIWVDSWAGGGWHVFAEVWRYVMGAIGVVFVAGFFAIASYGFYHRRRLVGNLVIDPLPGG